MRILSRALFILGALVLILFAVSNRETVSLALWPLPFLAELPLYLFFFLSLLLGVVSGAVAAWAAGHRDRREIRRHRRRIEGLERDLAATQSHLEHAHMGAPDQGQPRLDAPRSEPYP
ncbi:MAG: DUF1049 domain-containing protein [Alphaproteobacteria bacterium]|nr:DUF1049 domain-containing protein [Alphaproteobacteria bacterium]